MEKITRIFTDTSKQFFQLHGVDADEKVVVRRQLRRNQVLAFFGKLEPTVVGWRHAEARTIWRGSLSRSAMRRGSCRAVREGRATHRGSNPAFMSGTRAAQTILARGYQHPQTGDMGASQPIDANPDSACNRGPSAYGLPTLCAARSGRQ